jgi:hypothetical protein
MKYNNRIINLPSGINQLSGGGKRDERYLGGNL